MSGICAIWQKGSTGRRLSEALASVGGGLSLAAGERLIQKSGQDAGVAVCPAFERQQIFENERVLVASDADRYSAEALAGQYERLGADFVERLQGGFSLVLWDRRERKLLAAVDGFGIHRLAYFEDGKILAIASRVDALARTPGLTAEVNPRAIANFLNYGVNLAPETIF